MFVRDAKPWAAGPVHPLTGGQGSEGWLVLLVPKLFRMSVCVEKQVKALL